MNRDKNKSTWCADILTLFPDMFPGPLGQSLAGKALEEGKWVCRAHDLRKFGLGNHHAVDDTPYGGGPGMVLKPDVLESALTSLGDLKGRPVIVPTPRGRPISQKFVSHLAHNESGAVILCGRFEGMDQRVLDHFNAEEICWGDAILSGGDIPAMALLDAVVRLLPGVMGSDESEVCESFEQGLLEYPHYTRPALWNGIEVPPVLLSGNHEAIEEWRREEMIKTTKRVRPDLWERFKGKDQGKEK